MIEWVDEVYSVGITKIDDQHRQLIELINAIENCKDQKDHEFVEKVLNTLGMYTKVHFAFEESILKKLNFAEFDQHAGKHRIFAQRIESAVEQYHNSECREELLPGLLNFLRDWLLNHILVEDMKYKKFLFEE